MLLRTQRWRVWFIPVVLMTSSTGAQAQATNANGSGYGVLAICILVAAAICALAPIFVSESSSAGSLKLIAGIMCLSAVVGGGLAIGVGGLFGGALIVPLFGLLWIGSLIVGIAAHLSEAIRKNSRDATYRLLHNDDENLKPPAGASKRGRLEPYR
jgi:hypothetical protein